MQHRQTIKAMAIPHAGHLSMLLHVPTTYLINNRVCLRVSFSRQQRVLSNLKQQRDSNKVAGKSSFSLPVLFDIIHTVAIFFGSASQLSAHARRLIRSTSGMYLYTCLRVCIATGYGAIARDLTKFNDARADTHHR